MNSTAAQSGMSYLAWVGWQMKIPAEWRPIRIEGGWDKGAMFIADEEEPVLQVKWWRPGKARFEAERWMRRRLKALCLRASREAAPAPAGFAVTTWVSEDLLDGTAGLLRVWYGYAPEAGLLLEIVTGGETPTKIRKLILRQIIPSLVTYSSDVAVRWAVFGASFESPAEFTLTNKRLLLGDLTLEFHGKGRRLVLRQVYPAELALSRRKIERWIEVRAFREHRKYRADSSPEKWTVNSFGRKLEGTRVTGWKRLAFPLGSVSPRRSVAAAVVDRELDRLLLAELDSPGESDDALLASAIGGMNWAQLEPRGPL